MKKDVNILENSVTKVTKDFVSRDDLHAMNVGQEVEFFLPATEKLESARTTCNQMKLKGKRFSTKFNVDSVSILIKRLQ